MTGILQYFGRICGLILLCFALFACTTPMDDRRHPAVVAADIHTLLAVPFQDRRTGAGEPARATVRCPLCGMTTMTGPAESLRLDFLSEALVRLLATKGHFTIIAGAIPDALIPSDNGPFENLAGETTRQILVEAGRQVGADAVLTGHVYRLSERAGSAYAVSRPASVAFDLHLIRTSDGHVLWAGQFDETQRALSEDLLRADAFLRRGASWLTAEALALDGLKHIIAKMPKP